MTLGLAGRLALSFGILSMFSVSVSAVETNAEPFMTVRGRTAQPIGHYEFCLRYVAECSIKTAAEVRMRLTPKLWNQLVAVNNDVNTKIAPATDEEVYGKAEWWE